MNIIRPTTSLLTVLGLCASLQAQTLMLDFGPTAATGDWLTDSPYHSDGGSVVHNTWNTVTGDMPGGLVSSTGETTGVGVALGMADENFSTTLDLGLAVAASGLGTKISTGIYGSPSIGIDGILPSGLSNQDSRAVGLQISGLSAGTYDVYIVARNTSTATNYPQDIYAGVEGTAGNFDYSTYAPTGKQTLNYAGGATENIDSWSAGQNYVKFSITLTSGDVLNIASVGSVGEDRGFINAVQIVSASTIPEPSTYAAILGGLSLVGIVAIRRRR